MASETDGGDDQHRRVVDVRGVAETPDRLDDDEACDDGEQHSVRQGGEDLQPVQPERAVPSFAAPTGELDRRQRHADANHVGDHVPSVRQQGERVCRQAGDDLHDHEHGEHDERGEQGRLVPLTGTDRRVVVTLVMSRVRSHGIQSARRRVECHVPA